MSLAWVSIVFELVYIRREQVFSDPTEPFCRYRFGDGIIVQVLNSCEVFHHLLCVFGVDSESPCRQFNDSRSCSEHCARHYLILPEVSAFERDFELNFSGIDIRQPLDRHYRMLADGYQVSELVVPDNTVGVVRYVVPDFEFKRLSVEVGSVALRLAESVLALHLAVFIELRGEVIDLVLLSQLRGHIAVSKCLVIVSAAVFENPLVRTRGINKIFLSPLRNRLEFERVVADNSGK